MIKFDNFSKLHKDKDMLNLDKFPLEIGALQRKQGSNAFVNRSRGFACIIDTQNNELNFGMYRPAGASLAKISVKDEKEAIQIIKDFKIGDKKMSDYSPYNDNLDGRVSDLQNDMEFARDIIINMQDNERKFEKKISNLEDKIVTLKNAIIDEDYKLITFEYVENT